MNIQEKKAYLAGIIDGEGSVVCSQDHAGRWNRRLVITNTCVPLLDRCKEILDELGITYYCGNNRPYLEEEHHKVCYDLCIGNRRGLKILAELQLVTPKKEKLQYLLTTYVRPEKL
jgi:DNA-directed RNA polymerase subunit N (RpoN/RPB10)